MYSERRRYNSYNSYFENIFGGRAQKISIDAGFNCPNRDGKISTEGCSFCRNDAFNPSYCNKTKPIVQQIEEGIEFHKKRYRRAKTYLAYFQPYSNTYKSVDELFNIYNEALFHESIAGIVIGTRPDCIDDEKLTMLSEIQKHHYVMIEYGIESVYDTTLKRINRGHDYAVTQKTIEKTHRYGIPCGGHLIFGLPGETREMMLNAAHIISSLPLTTIKFHQLQIFKDTPLALEYINNPDDFQLFTIDEYIEFIISFVERLNPDFIIERFAGEVPPRYLVTIPWINLRYDRVLSLIENAMTTRNTFQGRLYEPTKQ